MKKQEIINILNEKMNDKQGKTFGVYHININDIWMWFSRYEITEQDFGTYLTLYYKSSFHNTETDIAEILLINIVSIR